MIAHLCLSSLRMIISRSNHVAESGIISFFFYVWALYHIFFTHSSVDRHSGCVRTLAVVNSTAVTLVCMHIFQLEFSLDIHSGVESLDRMVTLVLIFWRISILLHSGCTYLHFLQETQRMLKSQSNAETWGKPDSLTDRRGDKWIDGT